LPMALQVASRATTQPDEIHKHNLSSRSGP